MKLETIEYRILIDGLHALMKNYDDKIEYYEKIGRTNLVNDISKYYEELIGLRDKIRKLRDNNV